MEHIMKHIHFLELLARPFSEEQAKALISTSTEEQLNILSELALNVLQETIPLSRYYKNLLISDANVIRKLGDRRVQAKKRRSLAEHHLKTISTLLTVCLKNIRDGPGEYTFTS